MNIKTVNLALTNPSLMNIGKSIVNEYFDFIDVAACFENGIVNCFETNFHLTLIENLEPLVGDRLLYQFLKIENRELYRRLKKNKEISLKNSISLNQTDKGLALGVGLVDGEFKDIISEFKCKLDIYPNSSNGDSELIITITYLHLNVLKEDYDAILKEFESSIIPLTQVQGFQLISETGEKLLIDLN